MMGQDLSLFKQQALQWASQFDACCCLDSNDYSDTYGAFDFVLAVGIDQQVSSPAKGGFETLKSFYEDNKAWMFGLMGYDLKNDVEQLDSNNPDHLQFPDLFFFVPQYLLVIQKGILNVLIGDKQQVLAQISNKSFSNAQQSEPLELKSRISKKTYTDTVEKLREHILRGDIYEVNFCQEFFAENAQVDPLTVYDRLKKVSPTPFSGFLKIYDKYILCASPERFICKRGSKLISQPIKGTAKRSADPEEDTAIKLSLQRDAKEQAENVMIVDLVRNDLTKNAVKGSVKVEELFGIYGFKQVYQMISTVSAELSPEIHPVDALKNIFPMGSMTGAPKVKAMELIEQYEFSKRGAYSGTMGYISPEGDFDFNVIIRTILYNERAKYLSFQVGGAITYAADAGKEYEECMLKASAMLETLGQ